ncbi:MAG TPA: hypothetical protein VKZ18_12375 [Polyangia bacterium]|nr:hypothetical protein [Polyangia bacterium]
MSVEGEVSVPQPSVDQGRLARWRARVNRWIDRCGAWLTSSIETSSACLKPVDEGWRPLILLVAVGAVYLLSQRPMGANDFALVPQLAGGGLKVLDPEWQARIAAARTHWSTSVFLGAVLALAITVVSARRIYVARPSGRAWVFIVGVWFAIWPIFILFINYLTPPFGVHEMRFVRDRSSFNPAWRLGVVLAGLFSAAFLLAIALSFLRRSVATHPVEKDVQWLRDEQQTMRTLLSISVVWLVNGVIGVGLLHRMGSAVARADARSAMDALGASTTIFQGAFFSALLAAVFAPVELAIRDAAAGAGRLNGAEDTEAWLEKTGFGGSVSKALLKILAVFAPLLAGVLQNLAKL